MVLASWINFAAPNGLRYAPAGYWWAGRDPAGEREKLEARKRLEKRARREVAVPLVGCTPRSVPEGALPERGCVRH